MTKRHVYGAAMAAAVFALCAPPAWATLLAYEGFDYSGQTSLDGQTGGTGLTGAWDSTSGSATLSNDGTSLNYAGNPNPVAGDRVSDFPSLHNARRTLATPLVHAAGNVYYISFSMSLPADNFTFVQLSTSNDLGFGSSDRRYYAGFSSTDGATGNHYQYGAQTGTTFDGGYVQGETVMVVSKLVAEANRWWPHFTFYDNGASVPLTEPVSWEKSWGADAGDLGDLTHLMVGGHNSGQFDEIRIGTTYADVVVPEPASLALVTVGGLTILWRRRRGGRTARP